MAPYVYLAVERIPIDRNIDTLYFYPAKIRLKVGCQVAGAGVYFLTDVKSATWAVGHASYVWFVHYFWLGGRPIGRSTEGGAMKTGTVKWFNARKGYGFIKPVDGGFNVYVHINAVRRAGLVELKDGQKINFDSVVDERTGEIIAENLSVPPNALPPAPVLAPTARRKTS